MKIWFEWYKKLIFDQKWTYDSCKLSRRYEMYINSTALKSRQIPHRHFINTEPEGTKSKLREIAIWNTKTPPKTTVLSSWNKAVIDRRLCPRCCHLGSFLQPSRPWLQEAVPSISCLQRVFLRAKPKAACAPRCLSLAATSSSLSLCANMTSSIKPETHNVSIRRQRRTMP